MGFHRDPNTIPSALPADYNRKANFTDYEAANPGDNFRGTDLDAELNAAGTALAETQDRLALVQNDDGTLGNRVVSRDSLSSYVAFLLDSALKTGNYIAVGYASDDQGTDFSLTPTAGSTHIAFVVTDTPVFEPTAETFAGLWARFVGPDGDPTLSADLASTVEGKGASLVTLENGLTLQQYLPVRHLEPLADASYLQIDGLPISVGSVFIDVANIGAGVWYWDSAYPKAAADFGTVLDPEALNGWDGTAANLVSTVYASGGQGSGTGTGCWVRSIRSSFCSVRFFGAIGNGVVDDRVALQRALDTGRSLFIPAGTYLYLNTLSYQANGQSITGSGERSILKSGSGSVYLSSNGYHNCRIEHVLVDGHGTGDGITNGGIRLNGGTDGFTARNIAFSGGQQRIWLFTCQNVAVSQCRFDGCGYQIIQQQDYASSHVSVHHNLSIACTHDFVELNCENRALSRNWTVSDNIVLDVGGGGAELIANGGTDAAGWTNGGMAVLETIPGSFDSISKLHITADSNGDKISRTVSGLVVGELYYFTFKYNGSVGSLYDGSGLQWQDGAGNISGEGAVGYTFTAADTSVDLVLIEGSSADDTDFELWDFSLRRISTHKTEARFVGSTFCDGLVISNNIVDGGAGDSAIHLEGPGHTIISGNLLRNFRGASGAARFIYVLPQSEGAWAEPRADVIIDSNHFIVDKGWPTNTETFVGTGAVFDINALTITNNHFYWYGDYYSTIIPPESARVALGISIGATFGHAHLAGNHFENMATSLYLTSNEQGTPSRIVYPLTQRNTHRRCTTTYRSTGTGFWGYIERDVFDDCADNPFDFGNDPLGMDGCHFKDTVAQAWADGTLPWCAGAKPCTYQNSPNDDPIASLVSVPHGTATPLLTLGPRVSAIVTVFAERAGGASNNTRAAFFVSNRYGDFQASAIGAAQTAGTELPTVTLGGSGTDQQTLTVTYSGGAVSSYSTSVGVSGVFGI